MVMDGLVCIYYAVVHEKYIQGIPGLAQTETSKSLKMAKVCAVTMSEIKNKANLP